ncbi:hypothetical protein ABVK25_006495 [Lepraria finkii]|uniref:Uncharacterized protein n=1 Tax=Lepraria finkii TaxID=1340010 RepID=A0ABR4B5X5_9LECA
MIEGTIEAIAFVQTRRNPLIPAEAFRWDKTCVELLQIFDASVHTFGRTWTQVKGLVLRMSLVKLTSPTIFKRMIAKKDEPTSAPDKRKIMFCNANAITYLKPSDPFPRGDWKGQKVPGLA